MVLTTEWSQLEVITLQVANINSNRGGVAAGLGFTIAGGQSTGVIVKSIIPGGAAHRDQRLRFGDHILQIDSVNVRNLAANQVAAILRQLDRSQIKLIVARRVDTLIANGVNSLPIIPTSILTDPSLQFDYLNPIESDSNDVVLSTEEVESVLLQKFSVELDQRNHTNGMGITIVGYVCNEDEAICGIFVKGLSEQGAAAECGLIQVNDRIVAVSGQSLLGYRNSQAIELIRNKINSLDTVVLTLERQLLSGVSTSVSQQQQSQITSPNVATSPPRLSIIEDVVELSNNSNGHSPSSVLIQELHRKRQGENHRDDFEIVVAKFEKSTKCLGVSLEATTDGHGEIETHPRHYIRNILLQGPIGTNGILQCGDELLAMNGTEVIGVNHLQVVEILRNLPNVVEFICARRIPH